MCRNDKKEHQERQQQAKGIIKYKKPEWAHLYEDKYLIDSGIVKKTFKEALVDESPTLPVT